MAEVLGERTTNDGRAPLRAGLNHREVIAFVVALTAAWAGYFALAPLAGLPRPSPDHVHRDQAEGGRLPGTLRRYRLSTTSSRKTKNLRQKNLRQKNLRSAAAAAAAAASWVSAYALTNDHTAHFVRRAMLFQDVPRRS